VVLQLRAQGLEEGDEHPLCSLSDSRKPENYAHCLTIKVSQINCSINNYCTQSGHNTRYSGSFQDNLGMVVAECKTILDFPAARDDG